MCSQGARNSQEKVSERLVNGQDISPQSFTPPHTEATLPAVANQTKTTNTPIQTIRSGCGTVPQRKRFVPWTTQQAFFAISGGLAVDASHFWTDQRLTFTPQGLLQLANMDLLPAVPLEEVKDKSKADGFSKFLVCMQAAWFAIQSLVRLIQGLPLTLLEIHTLTHVACAFGMYAFWLKNHTE